MKNQRRHFFIDKPLQTRFALYVAATILIVCTVSGVGLYYGIWGSVIESFSDAELYKEIQIAARIQDYEHARESSRVSDPLPSLRLFREIDLLSARQREIMKEILVKSNAKLLKLGILLIILIGCGSIYITHKIAGPLFHFRKAFGDVKDGNLNTRIHLRKHDEGLPVARAFNEMISALDESLSNMKQSIDQSDPNNLKKEISKELSKFKTSRH